MGLKQTFSLVQTTFLLQIKCDCFGDGRSGRERESDAGAPRNLRPCWTEDCSTGRTSICLCSVYKHFPFQINNWGGPISLAVVFPEDVDDRTTERLVSCTARELDRLRHKHANVTQRLSGHFVIPRRRRVCRSEEIFEILKRDRSSGICMTRLNARTDEETVRAFISYPINVARNFARKMVKTKFMAIADLDHIFSANFEQKMAKLANETLEENSKLALVYRIFEVDKKVTRLPKTKEDLKKLVDERSACVFHPWFPGHRIRSLDEWFQANSSDPSEPPSIQFVQPYKKTNWEPQFVSLTTIPEHDETFFYPFADNTVLRWEMCRKGYEFAVVNDVFMFHHGIKAEAERRLVDKSRFTIERETRRAKAAFMRRMEEEHPETKGKCGF
ncbi:hypothetical protein L596_024124 [Steinernema carpocapsae]|uniref:N-acetyllactosaminide beta-1,3-N-acetylglucosaminyltransferase n=1 Tax=Steinernema carpocapsae TaxID=34508 RepID=A0A4V5ZZM2_STECR|nr:hypothetical protein L596_024124 [Steinernema carpocapsae]